MKSRTQAIPFDSLAVLLDIDKHPARIARKIFWSTVTPVNQEGPRVPSGPQFKNRNRILEHSKLIFRIAERSTFIYARGVNIEFPSRKRHIPD